MPSYDTLTVRSSWPLLIAPTPEGGSITITVLSDDTLYYSDSRQVSATNNQGSLTAGQSATFTVPQWVRSASFTVVRVVLSDAPIPVGEIPPSVVVASSPGAAQANTATVLLDTYYNSAAFANKTAAIQAAYAALLALGGGVLECGAGAKVYNLDNGPLQLSPNQPPVEIRGNRATFKATGTNPRLIDFTRTADYDTFQDIAINDLIFDANNITSASNQSIVGNLNGAWGQRINATRIRVRRCQWKNVPTGTTVGYQCFSLGSTHQASGETQTNLTDLRLEELRMRGGNVGVAILGNNAATTAGVEVYHDKIYIDVDHDTLVVPTSSTVAAGANVQIGALGWGDNCEVRITGANSSDVGIEIDAMQHSLVTGTITDARNAAFFVRNFHAPPVAAIQTALFRSCHHKVVNLNPDGTYSATGYELSHTSSPNPMFGTMILEDCTSDSRATNFQVVGLGIYVLGPATRLVTKNYQYNQDAINYSGGGNACPIYIAPPATDSTSASAPLAWTNIGGKINVAGASTSNYKGVWADLGASADLTLDGEGVAMEFATNLTSISAGQCVHVQIGSSSIPSPLPSVRGTFRFRIRSFAGADTAPYGAFIQPYSGGSQAITIAPKLIFSGCDCRALPVGSVGREVYANAAGTGTAQGSPSGSFPLVLYPRLVLANNDDNQSKGNLTQFSTVNSGTTSWSITNVTGWTQEWWFAQALTALTLNRRTDWNAASAVGGTPHSGPYRLAPGDQLNVTAATNITGHMMPARDV